MTVYHVYPEGFCKCTFASRQKALKEVDDLARHSDSGDVICFEIGSMTRREYEDLGEFQGY